MAPPPTPTPPSSPAIGLKEVVQQFWTDISGKEVQSAATYSYLWIADQVGHLAVGILVQFALFVVLDYLSGGAPSANLWAMLLAWAAVAWWEWRAYTTTAAEASGGSFPPDLTLLAKNALIATAYMAIGASIGASFHLPLSLALTAVLALLVLALALAPPWIRQKIIWQKAALPYLGRLANPALQTDQAGEIVALLTQAPPPKAAPRQVLVKGTIGAGRTSFCTALGTDSAFKDWKVRYLTFDKLCEFAPTTDGDDSGPKNIDFWPWRDSQLLVIDDVTTALIPGAGRSLPRKALAAAMVTALKSAGQDFTGELVVRHTLWVLGEMNNEEEAQWIAAIKDVCKAQQEPLVVELKGPR